MPKKLIPQQCMMPKVHDFEDILDIESYRPEVPDLEYGYLQIDEYRSRKKVRDCSTKPLGKRWVPLPKGSFVHTYNEDSVAADAYRNKVNTEPLRSCLRQPPYCKQAVAAEDSLTMEKWDIESATSTVASSSDSRRVRFPDGLTPGCWEYVEDELTSLGVIEYKPLAEWIYVDRDICGYSLHVYSPDDNMTKDFASSPFARMFIGQMDHMEFLGMWSERSVIESDSATHRHEERHIDKALLMAGVHADLIHAPAEGSYVGI